jgi:predicted acyltransferase
MVFSFSRIADQNKSQIALKILRRTALIFLVGLFLNWFPFYHKNIADLRIMGVLQKIALSYGGAAFIILYAKRSWLPYITGIILLGYWALLYFLGGDIPYSLEGNIVRTLDLQVLGESHLYGGFGIPFDPEGLVSSIPSIGTVLLGYIFGRRILETETRSRLVQEYAIAGILLVGAGLLWGMVFPIIKALWTSSYVLYTAGLALLVFAILIYIIDILNIKGWTYPFKVFGLNPLFSYALSGLVIRLFFYLLSFNDTNPYGWSYVNVFQPTFGNYLGSLMQAITYMLLIWFFAWLLYRKKIVIKL